MDTSDTNAGNIIEPTGETHDELEENLQQSFISSPLPIDRWDKWNVLLEKYKIAIVFFYLGIILTFGILTLPKLIDSTDSTFDAVPGTDGYDAEKIYEDAYGEDVNETIVVVLTQVNDFDESMINPRSSLYNETKKFLENYETYARGLERVVSLSVNSYYQLEDIGLTALAEQSDTREDGRVQKFTFLYEFDGNNGDAHEFLNDLTDYGDKNVPSALSIGYTGNWFFQKDMVSITQADMQQTLYFWLPLAMSILGCEVKNFLLLLIPLIMMIIVMACWIIITYPVALFSHVTELTIVIMMCITFAVAINFSVFLLTRTMQELPKGKDTAIAIAVKHSGHVIVVSSAMMTICMLEMMMLPIEIFTITGIGGCIVALSCLVVSLTFVPSLLHTRFGKWLMSKTYERCCCGIFSNMCSKINCCCCCGGTTEVPTTVDTATQEPLLPDDKMEHLSIDEDSGRVDTDTARQPDIITRHDNCWFRLGLKLTHSPFNHIILILVLGLVITPCAIFAPQLRCQLSINLLLPSDAQSMETYETLADTFGAGTQNPYKLVFDGSETNTTITTNEGFQIMHDVINTLARTAPSVSTEAYTGISYLGGNEISYDYFEQAIACGDNCGNESKKTIVYLNNEMTTPDDTTTYVYVILPMDPYSQDGTDWLVDAREALNNLGDEGKLGGYDVVIYGVVASGYDAIEECWKVFPIMIIVTFIVAIVLTGVFFRSYIIPLHLIFSIGCTIIFSFGFTVLCYQNGVCDWMGLKSNGEISFLAPLAAFTIIVGLGLNYDVFLINRALEFRLEGYDDISSILLGLEATGGGITAAGNIIMVVFGGLCFSKILMWNQFALLVVTAVQLDVYVVRTIIVPICLGYSAGHIWQPRKVPTVEKNEVEDYNNARQP